ncbi:uncharacterized protein LOC106640189 [Copidosoma floridanum]|uniref:uncharacterized protein LOC106640189 n=1 Tax=Copidosoma floridanum TaxID=29053 RepID=UPI0006C9820F|nr:uncharacterized protein LOC106640189 [Copidosoma floridanum]
MKNIEIKAKVSNIDAVEAKAAELSDTAMVVIKQHDTFYHVPGNQVALGGRLKLREFEDGTGELIYYERPDVQGPKLSSYSKVDLDAKKCKELKQVLSVSNGVLGVVEKTRHLYMSGNTRIHIDRVKDLGHFMEFEVVLESEKQLEEGQKIAESLIQKFEIKEDSLLSGAYMDMILKM